MASLATVGVGVEVGVGVRVGRPEIGVRVGVKVARLALGVCVGGRVGSEVRVGSGVRVGTGVRVGSEAAPTDAAASSTTDDNAPGRSHALRLYIIGTIGHGRGFFNDKVQARPPSVNFFRSRIWSRRSGGINCSSVMTWRSDLFSARAFLNTLAAAS